MLQDRLTRARVDKDKIGIHLTTEVNYWAKQLKSTPEKLKLAVAAVGPQLNDVRKWLYNN